MNKKRLSLNLIGQLVSFACSLGIGFFLTPYIVSNLGQETYGFVGLANNFTSYISLFTIAIDGMLSRYVTIEYSKKEHEEASRYLSTAFIAKAAISLILLIPMLLLVSKLEYVVNVSSGIVQDVRILWLLIFLAFLGNLSFGSFNTSLFAANRLDIQAVISVLCNLLRASVLIITFAFFPAHVWYVGFATLLSSIVSLTVTYLIKKHIMPEVKVSPKYFNFKYIKRLVVVGIWNSLNKLQQILTDGLDLLITNLFINGAEMGLLSVAKTIPVHISSLISTVASSFDPSMTISYAKNDKSEFLSTTKFAMKFSGFLCSIPILGFIAFGTKFYSLWMPSLNADEISKVQILSVLTMLPQIFSVYVYPLYTVNTITTKLKVPVLLSLCIGVANVVIVYVLLRTTGLGVYAVAGVSTIMWTLRVFLFVPTYAAWSLKMKLSTFYKPLLKGVLNVVITGFVLCLISYFTNANSWIELALICLPAGLVGYILCFFIMFERSEREKVITMVKNKLPGKR